jgi:tetratricopeptide (TPR) repeat protein
MARAYEHRARLYGQTGRYDQAIQDYSKAIQLTPHDADAFVGRGKVYMSRGLYEPAIQDFNTAALIAPGDAVIARDLQQAMGEKGKQDVARKLSVESHFTN